jgi:hypothetical protein
MRIITGQPGNGKTLYMLSLLMAAIEDNRKAVQAGKEARPIYAVGIDGLQPGLCETSQDGREWQSFPDGSIIFIDEAWKWFGHLHDARQAPTPAHVLALAEHRHRGMDLVMTTQMANQLYPFMRGLVGGAGGGHTHVARHFGTSLCTIYNWPELNEDTKSPAQRERAVSEKWVQPSKLFALYKSATIHTVKRSLPMRLILIPASIAAAVGLFWYGYLSYSKFSHPQVKAASGAAAAAAASGGEMQERPKTPTTAQGWVDALRPALPGLAYTAPIFAAQFKVQSIPRTFCAIVGGDYRNTASSHCRCYTEQFTALAISDPVCRSLAVDGYYDPTRPPPSPASSSMFQSDPPPSSTVQLLQAPGRKPDTFPAYQPPEASL